MTRRTAIGLLVFCVLGLVVSGLSAYVHYRLVDRARDTRASARSMPRGTARRCTKAGSARSVACRSPSPASSGSSRATMLVAASWRGAPARAGDSAGGAVKTARRGRPPPASTPDRFADYAPLVSVCVVGRRPGVRDVLRVRLVRRAEDRLRAMPADLRIRHRDFHPVWIGNGPLHAITAPAVPCAICAR